MKSAKPVSPRAGLPRAGLLRRLGAIFYDTLLLIAVLLVATLLAVAANGGAAIESSPLLTTYLFLVTFFYFAWFWVRGGRTLGMAAWRIQVQLRDGGPITWLHALLRFMVAMASWAPAGAGFLWSLVDRDGMTWHDRYSETVLVVLPKQDR